MCVCVCCQGGRGQGAGGLGLEERLDFLRFTVEKFRLNKCLYLFLWKGRRSRQERKVGQKVCVFVLGYWDERESEIVF